MPEKCEFVDYNGQEIYYCNFSNLSSDQFIESLKEDETFREANLERIRLQLINIEGTVISTDGMKKIKEIMTSQDNIEKRAIVGVTGIKKVFLSAANNVGKVSIKPFKNIQEARSYLTNK